MKGMNSWFHCIVSLTCGELWSEFFGLLLFFSSTSSSSSLFDLSSLRFLLLLRGVDSSSSSVAFLEDSSGDLDEALFFFGFSALGSFAFLGFTLEKYKKTQTNYLTSEVIHSGNFLRPELVGDVSLGGDDPSYTLSFNLKGILAAKVVTRVKLMCWFFSKKPTHEFHSCYYF